ncbi:MAG: hypothetical protein JW818_00970 [Pirellulales bacterium]|nr:hypothetical protein [Pirellulales bacterium]
MANRVFSSLAALRRTSRSSHFWRGWPAIGLTFLAVSLYCGGQGSSSAGAERSLASDYDNATRLLERVRDAESAKLVVRGLEHFFNQIKESRELRTKQRLGVDPESRDAGKRLLGQVRRVLRIRDLPQDLYRVVRRMGVHFFSAPSKRGRDADAQAARNAAEYRKTLMAKLEEYDPREVVVVRIVNLPSTSAKKVFDRIAAAAPGATMVRCASGTQGQQACLFPVKDYAALKQAVSFCEIVWENPSAGLMVAKMKRTAHDAQLAQQTSRQEQSPDDSGAPTANPSPSQPSQLVQSKPGTSGYFEKLADDVLSDDPEVRYRAVSKLLNTKPDKVESVETRNKIIQAFGKLAENDDFKIRRIGIRGIVIWGYKTPIVPKKTSGHGHPSHGDRSSTPELSGNESPQQPPRLAQGGPNTPAYFEMLADNLLSNDRGKQSQAITALLAIQPDKVESFETQKKIARAFRTLAQDSSPQKRRYGIHGLVIWGGKYSTPILLEIFKTSNSMERRQLYTAFGDLKDPAAAPAIAAQLTNRNEQKDAERCLMKIGTAVEDAVLALTRSPDRNMRLAAMEMLGNVGTEKSLLTLNRVMTNGTPDDKRIAKSAIRRIRYRTSKNPSPKPGPG